MSDMPTVAQSEEEEEEGEVSWAGRTRRAGPARSGGGVIFFLKLVVEWCHAVFLHLHLFTRRHEAPVATSRVTSRPRVVPVLFILMPCEQQ
ncbi:hypothetical protein EYF80_060423 [Liparis tanakae]|uniref:Uncharacterized protein n=1 Tax=Liparis tanakae TaxID=230148 RepID=A0A4Z2EKF9_9TELE|nr:hypothetical protein EYF80_060423 [Liparis tanakae]